MWIYVILDFSAFYIIKHCIMILEAFIFLSLNMRKIF